MRYTEPNVYGVKHKNFETRMKSRSGGIFSALSDYVLDAGGVIYGCSLNREFLAEHRRAETKTERDRMRGSKYIQSDMKNCFRNVLADLDTGRTVLFSGTSCQIAGLYGYLRKDYSNLICIDIVCHGVPSPKVWKSYLKWTEGKHHMSVCKVDFRNKKDYGWEDHVETLYLKNDRKKKKVNERIFTTLFVDHAILRPACYECPYKSIMHPADITIADYWGIDQAAPGFSDNKGVSLVLVNDEKGQKLFDNVVGDVELVNTCIEDSMQPPLIAPFPSPKNRNQFWIDYKTKSFSYIVKNYGGKSFKRKAFVALVKLKRKVLH